MMSTLATTPVKTSPPSGPVHGSVADLAKLTIDIQSACNLGGLSRGLVELIDQLRPLIGDQPIERNPLVQLWVRKLTQLCYMDTLEDGMFAKYSEAYQACRKLAGLS